MINLHWRQGVLTIVGVPVGYRYFVADRTQEQLGADPEDKAHHLVNKVHAGKRLIRVDVPEGDVLFRARSGDPYRPNYEFQGRTGVLPVRLQIRSIPRYIPVFKKNINFDECTYEQIECDPELDEWPDPRTKPVPR